MTGGELGAPNLKHPPARVGAYSAASAGVATGGDDDEAPAEGPIPSAKRGGWPPGPCFSPWRERVWSRLVLRVAVALAFAALVVRRFVHAAGVPAARDADRRACALGGRRGGRLSAREERGTRGRGAARERACAEEELHGNVAVVLVEGPYHTWFGHQWGDTGEQQASSRQRLRALLRELLGDAGPPPERVVIAGFSQGAGVAIDVAVEEPRFGGLASLSPCHSMLRGELPKRGDLRVLLAHGAADAVCPVEESALARARPRRGRTRRRGTSSSMDRTQFPWSGRAGARDVRDRVRDTPQC